MTVTTILLRYGIVAVALAEAAVRAAALDQAAIETALDQYVADANLRRQCAVEILAARLAPQAPAPVVAAPAAPAAPANAGGIVGVPVTVAPVQLALAPVQGAAPAAPAPAPVVAPAPAAYSHWWVWVILAALLVIGVISAFALGYSRSADSNAKAAVTAAQGIVPALQPSLDGIRAEAKAAKDAAQIGAKEIVEARTDLNKIGTDVKAVAATVDCISSRMATSAQVEEQSRRFLYALKRVEHTQKQQGRAVFNYFPPAR